MTDTHRQDGTPATYPTRHTVVVPNSINMVSLLGPGDEHLALIERSFEADVHVRGNRITLYGEPGEVALAERLLDELVTIIRTGQGVTPETVERVLGMLRAETTERPADVLSLNILSNRGRSIRPKTLNQKRYVDSIDKHTVVFGIGPAGTGKTYLAIAKAVQALQTKHVNRIILTRPAVEAGEQLGFLPGTLSEKIDPYLRPLYDALHDMLDPEIDPQAARGRDDRGRAAGVHARAHLERRLHHPGRGAEHLDGTDEDVPDPARLRLQDGGHRRHHPGRPAGRDQVGLRVVGASSTGVDDIVFNLTNHDVVRHKLVGRIVAAYDKFDARGGFAGAGPGGTRMSIDISNESGHDLDVKQMAALSRFALDQLRIHPLAELSILAVDEAP